MTIIKVCFQVIMMGKPKGMKAILLEIIWKIGIRKIVNKFYPDIM